MILTSNLRGPESPERGLHQEVSQLLKGSGGERHLLPRLPEHHGDEGFP